MDVLHTHTKKSDDNIISEIGLCTYIRPDHKTTVDHNGQPYAFNYIFFNLIKMAELKI